jgi:hypothetical protein
VQMREHDTLSRRTNLRNYITSGQFFRVGKRR